MTATVKIIQQVIEVLKERGLAKLTLEDPDTHAVCIMGAVNVVLTGDPMQVPPIKDRTFERVMRALHDALPKGWRRDYVYVDWQAVVDYNNARATDHSDMLRLCRRAIARRTSKK